MMQTCELRLDQNDPHAACVDGMRVLSVVTCNAESGGIGDVLRFMHGCNRSQPHVDLLRHANAILAHVARYQQMHHALLASPDCVQVIAEQLQMFRDKEVCTKPRFIS